MKLLKYIFLGFIQGFTETIPVSSSGHLMIFKNIMNVDVDFNMSNQMMGGQGTVSQPIIEPMQERVVNRTIMHEVPQE